MNDEFIQEIDSSMTEFVHDMSPELTKYIRDSFIENQGNFLKAKNVHLELVVDTNIMFQQVRAMMVHNKEPFLAKLVKNPFFRVYGPSQLEEELYAKIKIKFPKDKKTRDLNIEACLQSAQELLKEIEIRDDISAEAFERAEGYLSNRDKDDINFLALNFSLQAHGVLTKDKDITDIEEVATWDLSDAGAVITKIHKGSMSFLIFEHSLDLLFNIVSYVVQAVWKGIILLVHAISKLFTSIVKGSISALSKIPPTIAAILGIASIVALFFKEVRQEVSNCLSMIWDEVKPAIKSAKELFKKLIQALKELLEAIKPIAVGTFDVYKYLFDQSQLAILELERLESSRA